MLDASMSTKISIEAVQPRRLAAVRRRVHLQEIATTWRPALDKVWEFLKQHPGLRTDGHNVFLYHHPPNRQSAMSIDFGVEVSRAFAPEGEISLAETPAGKVLTAMHIGPYERLSETHNAIHAWATANKLSFAGKSWEIYGDWTDNPAKLETRIEYLLA